MSWTNSEWTEYAAWIRDRWPSLNWKPETIAALRTDIEGQSIDDAWAAIIHHRDKGTEWLTPANIWAATERARLDRVAEERRNRPALPPPSGVITRAEWLESAGFASWDEAVRAEHRKMVQGGELVMAGLHGQQIRRPHDPDCRLCAAESVTVGAS